MRTEVWGSLWPVHTVAEKCDCRRIRRLSPLSRRFLRQSHFSATVWTGLYKEPGDPILGWVGAFGESIAETGGCFWVFFLALSVINML